MKSPLVVSCVIGIASGVLAALCGVGGGIIMVPAFVAFLGLSQKSATATSMAVIVPTAIAATIRHIHNRYVDWNVVVMTALSATLVSFFVADYVKKLGNETLTRIFAILILIVGTKMLLYPEQRAAPKPSVESVVAVNDSESAVKDGAVEASDRQAWQQYAFPLLIGVVSGVLAALCGVGGGIIMVPAFVLLLSFDQKLATGTSMAVIIPTAIAATSRHVMNKLVDWRVFVPTAVSATLVSFFVADYVRTLEHHVLTRIFAIVVVLVGVKMLMTPGTKPAAPPPSPASGTQRIGTK
ncbi:MAG: sulfite exporter TauE/SafE family protein [Planctomycetaceae bacterium]|nr:sulfite exporter TauE/SafE family protein [Planctomycetaceae bacterium]